MEKPTKHGEATYDYHECRDYLQARDDYDERDYAGQDRGNPTAPYQDFWHFVLDHVPGLNNFSEFTMKESWGRNAAPWQREILGKYLDAFGEMNAESQRAIDFSIWW